MNIENVLNVRLALEKRAREGISAEQHVSCKLNDEQETIKWRSEVSLPGWRYNKHPEIRSGLAY